MKLSLLVAGLIFASPIALANTLYYVGEAVTTDTSGVKTTSAYLIARTTDGEENTITEVATVKQGDKFVEFKSVMKIDGSDFTMEADATIGKGRLIGPKWQWTYLEGEFHSESALFSMRIVDYNFFADPQMITAHKEYFITSRDDKVEKPMAVEDALLHRTDEATYLLNRIKLLGHM